MVIFQLKLYLIYVIKRKASKIQFPSCILSFNILPQSFLMMIRHFINQQISKNHTTWKHMPKLNLALQRLRRGIKILSLTCCADNTINLCNPINPPGNFTQKPFIFKCNRFFTQRKEFSRNFG